MIQNSPGPQNSGVGSISRTHVSETQQISLPLQVTLLKAHNLPRLKTVLGRKRRFYATVNHGERSWQTQAVRSVGQRVEWNENVDAFTVQPSSSITISLYAKKTVGTDVLIGRQEVTCEPRNELDIVLGHAGRHGGRNTPEPATVFLTIAASANTGSSLSGVVNTPNPTTADPASLVTTGPHLLPIKGDIAGLPTAGGPTVESRDTLRHAQEALENIDTMKTWKNAVNAVQWVMGTVSKIAELNPYASLAWNMLSKIPEVLLQQVQRDDNIQTLLEAIVDAFEFAEEADPLRDIRPESRQAKILEDMLRCVTECAEFITSYAEDVNVGKRVLKNIVGPVDEEIEQHRSNLVRLRESFLARAAVITEVTVIEAELGAIIRELPYKGGWRLGDEMRCLSGTREDFLDHIVKWIENPESNRGLVLFGQAGTGKSSIAYEIAHRFDDKYLGCYFAFMRKEQSRDGAYQLFTTIARDLSDRNLAFKHALGKVVKDKSSLRNTRNYRKLFESLLIEPLKDLSLPTPVLIIIDALDESGDAVGQTGLHTFLAEHLAELPRAFRILITSRPEGGIEPAFTGASSVDTLYMDDSELASKTEQDILLYLQKNLPRDVFKEHGAELAKASEGLFQWAAAASGFINGPPASFGFSKRKCVQRLLGHSRDHSGEDPLDKLYKEILEGYFEPQEAQILFRSVMGQLFAAVEPLSIDSLIALRRHAPIDDAEDSDPVLEMLRHLGSLLSHVTSSDHTRPIVPLHTSFRDFLTSRKNNMFYVDLDDAHRELAHSCVSLMLVKLKFNICELESSYLANSDVVDLNSRVSKNIPPALSYACIFWDNHLKHVDFEQDLFAKFGSLFETKFLFWLEVLSIKCKVNAALPALSSLTTWLRSGKSKPSETAEKLVAIVNDGSSFVRYFGMPIARSAPHIYISALPFSPSSSHIAKHYLHLFSRTLCLERGQLSHWPALEMTIQAHEEPIESVAFSPDGQRIASGSRDCTIRVLDSTTGELVAGPFTGHTGTVESVAFSPGGRHIASGSRDGTIRVWDAATGEIFAGPFTSHTGMVHSVAYSPDGERIASALGGGTIWVWDVAKGAVVAGPFTGHTTWVGCVAFSPDGKRIVSASGDRTIRVWDAATGEVVAGPFTRHTDKVYVVSFSPNGQVIASASTDCMIHVSDAATGEVIVGPFIGHTDHVYSVAFSPDGQLIASASFDYTIRVWDSSTGSVVAGPFIGHTDFVLSVTFSPDGQRVTSASCDRTVRVWGITADIVVDPLPGHTNWVYAVAFSPDSRRVASGSYDHTICVWDTTTGQVASGPFAGHTGRVYSVGFSPDGQRIASASADRTIRVWDAVTGEMVVGPFTGHTDKINFVAFSPDGRRIASASHDRTIHIWDAATGVVVVGPFSGHTNRVFSVAFSPDGKRIVSASADRTIRVWDAEKGEAIGDPFTGHTELVRSVAFSPDGKHIASASRDCTIRVWDAATGEAIAPFTGHTDEVLSVAFSPDGQHIISASSDCTMRMWNSATGEAIACPFTGHRVRVFCAAFSPDGRWIASASEDNTIRLWDAPTVANTLPGYTESVDSVVVSSDITGRASHDHTVCAKTENIGKDDIMNKFLINSDGWMCGEKGELLLWIPQIHRPYFHRSNTVWIAGRYETWLELQNFVHGSDWATVHHDV